MAETGTLEAIAAELAEALSALEETARPANLAVLLGGLGLDQPPDLQADAQLAQALGTVIGGVQALVPEVEALTKAADEGDLLALIEAGAQVLVRCAAVIDALDVVGQRLQALLASSPDGLALAGELAERVFGDVLATYLEARAPLLRRVLTLVTVVERETVTLQLGGRGVPVVRKRLFLDRIPRIFTDPLGLLQAGYGWGRTDFDAPKLLRRIAELFEPLQPIAAYGDVDGPPVPPVLDFGNFTLGPAPTSPPGLTGELFVDLGADVTVPLGRLSDQWRAELALGGNFREGLKATLVPPTALELEPPAGSLDGRVAIQVIGEGPAGKPLCLFSLAGASRVEADSVTAGVVARASWNTSTGRAEADVGIRAAIQKGRLLVTSPSEDGFLAKVLPPDGMEVDFDLAVGWSAARGFEIEGGAGLTVALPVNKALGPLLLSTVNIGARVESTVLGLTAGLTARAEIGPLSAVVEDIGLRLDLDLGRRGNLGPVDLAVGFKPPAGLGLTVDAAVVKGGGYLRIDPARGEYAGALELSFSVFSLKALGILTTKRSDGSPGWALLIMIYGQFPTPLQLSWGFTLSGVGGLIGAHHGADRPQLEAGMRTGAFDSILFPRDPVGDAPTIISQLRTIFPIRPDALVVGPMLELGWGTPNIIKIRLVLLVQLDHVFDGGALSVKQILLLGQLDVLLPPGVEQDLALLRLLVDILGYVDLEERVLGFAARLRDSRVALVTLTGMLVVRVSWGDRPSFVLAAGGFHPRFNDLPPGLPAPIDRLGAGFSIGPVAIAITGYFAVTPATVQAGARVDAHAVLGPVEVKGYFGFDTIFYFEPTFHFEIDADCGFAVRWRGHTLAGVDFHGTLAGPGRWHLVGRAEFSILFWTVPIPIDEAWGDPPALPPIPGTDVLALVAVDITSRDCWSAFEPAGGAALVTLSAPAGATQALAHPLSRLRFTQRHVPFGLEMQRFGRTPILGPKRLDVTEVRVGTSILPPVYAPEYFARSSFLDLSSEEKLAAPSFEPFPAGIEVGSEAYGVGPDLPVPLEYETAYLNLDEPAAPLVRDRVRSALRFDHLLVHAGQADVARSRLRSRARLAPKQKARIRVTEAPLATASAESLKVSGPALGVAIRYSLTLAGQAVPAGAVIVETFELAG